MDNNVVKGAIKKFNIEAIGYINLFEKITNCKVKDCIINQDGLIFIVDSIYIGRILGQKGRNLRKIEEKFNRKIKIIEFSNDIGKFIRNLVYPIKPKEIKIAENRVEIAANDHRTKGLLLGRDRKNLKRLQELVSRYFSHSVEVI